MNRLSYMDENYQAIVSRMRVAEERAGRSATLIAAVKYTDAEHIRYLREVLGVCDLGENRVQHLLEHWEALRDCEGLRFHFIGKLQTNKVKYIADKVCMVHSLDSLKLAAELQKQLEKHDREMDVLVEINSGGEESKSGVAPEEAAEFCAALSDFPRLRLRGFMTMAPKCEKIEEYRKYFRETFDLGLDIWEKKLHNIGRPLFSMGMSDSLDVAIEEGADMIRVGRGLFAPPSNEKND